MFLSLFQEWGLGTIGRKNCHYLIYWHETLTSVCASVANGLNFTCFHDWIGTASSREVEDMIEDLKKKFTSLKKSIREYLEKHKVPVKDVADVLTQLSPDDDECHRMFLQKHVRDLVTAVDHSELFGTMNFHWNYLDPSLLDHLATELDLKEVKENMKAYKSDLRQFRATTPLTLFCQTQKRKRIKLSPKFKEMVAKFKLPNDATLEVVEQFRQEYASHYNVHKFAMMVANVRSGSFFITWFIPESLVQKLTGKVPFEILQKYSVFSLTIAGICVYSHGKVSVSQAK